MISQPWTVADVEAAVAELSEHEEEWNLAGWGAGYSRDGIDRGSAWIEKGSKPHPDLLAWIASLPHPDMINIREYGAPEPGDGPDVDTPPDQQGVPM